MNTSTSDMTVSPPKALHIGLWVAQVLLGLAFIMAGQMKLFGDLAEVVKTVPWVADLPQLTRFIGLSELLGGLGLILPAATRIKPVLTPVAALGLLTVMVLAMGFHVMRGELGALPINLVMGGIAAFIAWGRFKKAPIAPRS